jgi:hypothetical protein
MIGFAGKAFGIGLAALAVAALAAAPMKARPNTQDEGIFPAGSEHNDQQLDQPTQLL